MNISKKHRIYAADDDFAAFDESPDMSDMSDMTEDDDAFNDQLDDIADDIEDMKDDVNEVEEDDPSIELENNINNHYIAECERCHGIFISAVSESDQVIDKVSGVCPLCDHETDQYLKWIIKSVD